MARRFRHHHPAAAVPAAGARRGGHERLLEHTSAFTVFPDDGIRIDPHMIRRVTSYDGALLEEAHPEVHDVIEPDVARTMTAMLEDVMNSSAPACQARVLGRPAGGKTGHHARISPTPGSSASRHNSPQASGWASTTSQISLGKSRPPRKPAHSSAAAADLAGIHAVSFRPRVIAPEFGFAQVAAHINNVARESAGSQRGSPLLHFTDDRNVD
jgi:hypothetical protein